MRKVFLLFCFFYHVAVFSQLNTEFKAARDSFMVYEYIDTLKAKKFLNKSYLIAKKESTEILLCEYYLLKGWYLQDRSNFYQSLDGVTTFEWTIKYSPQVLNLVT